MTKAAHIFAAWLQEHGITGEDLDNMSEAQYALALNLARMEGLGPSREDVSSAMAKRQQQYQPPQPGFSSRLAALKEQTQ